MLFINSEEFIFRIYASFIPPYNKTYQKVYVDLFGPLVAVLFLFVFLWYGHTMKEIKIYFSPIETTLAYIILMPLLSFALCKLGNSNLNFSEIICLVGYALYGHLFTLWVSFLFFSDESNFIFFISMVIFGGFSTLRMTLIFLNSITVPAARLVVCSLISVANILFLLLFHFGYMHRTYSYSNVVIDNRW